MKGTLFSVALALGTASTASGDILANTRVVLAVGDAVAGNAQSTVGGVLWYSIGSDGSVGLNLGISSPARAGIFTASQRVAHPLALTGEQAPGADPSQVFSSLNNGLAMVVHDSEWTAFRGLLIGPGTTDANRTGIWTTGANGLELRMRGAASVPEAGAGVTFGDIGALHRAEPGVVVNSTRLAKASGGNPDDSAIWRLSKSGRSMLVRTGDPVPGVAGAVFQSLYEDQDYAIARTGIATGQSGRTILAARAKKGNSIVPGMWSWTAAGGLQKVAVQGETGFFGFDPRITLAQHSPVAVGNGKYAAFRTFLQAPSSTGLVDKTTDTAMVLMDFTSELLPTLKVLARENDPIPDRAVPWRIAVFTGSGVDNSEFFNPSVNVRGEAAFVASLDIPGYTGGGSAVFLSDSTGLHTLMMSGDIIPDRPGRRKWNGAGADANINEYGDVAFLGSINNMSGLSGLFCFQNDYGFRTIAIRGDKIEVTPGVFKTVNEFQGSNDGVGYTPPSWGPDRRLYYWVQFTDFSTALVSTVIPSPSTAMPIMAMFVACGSRRRRTS